MLRSLLSSYSRSKVLGALSTLSRPCGVRETSYLTGLAPRAVQQVFESLGELFLVKDGKRQLQADANLKKSLLEVFTVLEREERALRAVHEQKKFDESLTLTDSARELHYGTSV
jgi:hypothetical protein